MLEKIVYPFAYAVGWLKGWTSHFWSVLRIYMKLRKNKKVSENLNFNQIMDLITIIELRYVNSMYRRDIDFSDQETFKEWYNVWGDRLINEYSEYLKAKGP